MTNPKNEFTPEQIAQIAEIVKSCQKPSFIAQGTTWAVSMLVAYRQLLIGLVLGVGIMLPFAVGSSSKMFERLHPFSIIQTDSPQAIAKVAPNTPSKRKMIQIACQETAAAIRAETIKTRSEAMTNLNTSLASVIAHPQWKATVGRINTILDKTNGLADLADKLNDISKAFEDE